MEEGAQIQPRIPTDEELRTFAEEKIRPLHSLSARLLGIHKAMSSRFHGKAYKEAKDLPGADQCLLGGVIITAEGFKGVQDNSLARRLRETFGIGFFGGDRGYEELYGYLIKDLPAETRIQVDRTTFISRVESVHRLTGRVLKHLALGNPEEPLTEDADSRLGKPEELADNFEEMHRELLFYLNEATLFVFSIRCITRAYFMHAFRAGADDFKKACDRYGLKPLWEPALEGDMKEDYCLWGIGLSDESLGSWLLNLAYTTHMVSYGGFWEQEGHRDYMERAISNLRDAGFTLPDSLRKAVSNLPYRSYRATMRLTGLTGALLDNGYASKSYPKYASREIAPPLHAIDLLRAMAPAVLVGLVDIVHGVSRTQGEGIGIYAPEEFFKAFSKGAE